MLSRGDGAGKVTALVPCKSTDPLFTSQIMIPAKKTGRDAVIRKSRENGGELLRRSLISGLIR